MRAGRLGFGRMSSVCRSFVGSGSFVQSLICSGTEEPGCARSAQVGGWNAFAACASGRSTDRCRCIAAMVPCSGLETCMFGECHQAHLVLSWRSHMTGVRVTSPGAAAKASASGTSAFGDQHGLRQGHVGGRA